MSVESGTETAGSSSSLVLDTFVYEENIVACTAVDLEEENGGREVDGRSWS